MSSEFKVPYTQIVAISPHSGADRLEIATVYGFQVVVRKGQYSVGDKVLYVPIDAILPPALEAKLFPSDAKIKLHGSRVRQIRIRGFASQGMLIAREDLPTVKLVLETDYAATLGITKYEPPAVGPAGVRGASKLKKKIHEHPDFHKYGGLDNIKWFPDMFAVGEPVVIQEKLHGTNARASKLSYRTDTLWRKLRKFVGLAPAYETHYGSNNVDISAATDYKGYYGEDLYGKVFNELNVWKRLHVGEIVYGEIIGPGIQKNYSYGLTRHTFVLFDVKRHGVWLDPEEVAQFALERGFVMVPVLAMGPYEPEIAKSLASGRSAYDPATGVIEGVVIKAANGYDTGSGKKALKLINEKYLDDTANTDYH